ncbi:MAG TPA: MFS transporter [Steroidobacteraceae bacterium]|nr:MFS transporter [Steroidobacteraceae bacterium]
MSPLRELRAAVAQPSMRIALIVACAQFMQNLDGTIIVTALPAMAQSFATSASRMSEGITAYALAAAVCIPASGWLADRMGARNLFCAAIGLFTVASMGCGIAPGFGTFIAARLLQGGTAAMMSPVGRMIVLHNSDRRELMQTLSTLVWPSLLAPVIGPPLGGFITTAVSWRWIFYINLPFGVAAIALALAMIPNRRGEARSSFDATGFLLLAVAIGCLTYGFDLAGGERIQAATTVALLGAAAVAGTLALRHLASVPGPVVSLDPLRRHAFFVACVAGGGISRAAISATPFLLPLMLEVGFGLSPLDAGLLLLVYMLANLLMKTATNPIVRRFGMRKVLVVNGVIAAAGIAACALISPGLPTLLTGAILLLAGASRSMQFTALTFTTFAEIGPEERSPASILSSLTQQIAAGVGVALAALLLNFSRLLRHAARLAPFDFRLALVLMGAFGALAVFSYAALAEGTGAEVSGHGSRAAG